MYILKYRAVLSLGNFKRTGIFIRAFKRILNLEFESGLSFLLFKLPITRVFSPSPNFTFK